MDSNAMVRVLLLAGAIAGIPALAAAATCESLSALPLATGSVTGAATVAAGAFAPPSGRTGGPGGESPFGRLGPFCRASATLKPGPRSDIRMEVWMPVAGWNGKLQVVGNGGFAGTISYSAMAAALAAGYATASTDTGHTGPSSNTFANEDVLQDFAHRAIHETTAAAKRLVNGFYGEGPKFSYFNGCSTGGRQALTAAQRYPADFDGIVAGAPAIRTSAQAFGQIWIYQAMATPAGVLPRETLAFVNERVLSACDDLDGVTDGVLENPMACTFDPQVLACREGASADACLTPPQVEAVRKIYAGASNTLTGAPIFPGLERGSETGWSATPVGYAVDYFKYIVFKDPGWDPKALNFDAPVPLAGRPETLVFEAADADLTPFTSRGGKLILYQGWAEPGIPPREIVRYYEDVRQKTESAAQAVRLFMVPGMGHCGGGNGTSTFDMVAALDRWKETGAAPDEIPAARLRQGTVDRTRPLCSWPAVAVYSGGGSIDEAASFECRAPR